MTRPHGSSHSSPVVGSVPAVPQWGRWCADHNRAECTKSRSKGRGHCHGAAVKGTDACTVHAGVKLEVAKVQGEARITAWRAIGSNATIDYRMAVLGVLQMTWLRLAAYGELLRRQVATEGDQASDPAETDEPQASGLIGYRYGAAGSNGTVYVQSEEVRALVALEAAERDRVVKYAKTAHDMGISDRLTSLAERWGDVVATRISAMIADLDLTPEQQARVPELVSRHLGSIDVESISAAPPGKK
jgi:hypothetical protein